MHFARHEGLCCWSCAQVMAMQCHRPFITLSWFSGLRSPSLLPFTRPLRSWGIIWIFDKVKLHCFRRLLPLCKTQLRSTKLLTPPLRCKQSQRNKPGIGSLQRRSCYSWSRWSEHVASHVGPPARSLRPSLAAPASVASLPIDHTEPLELARCNGYPFGARQTSSNLR